MVHYLDTRLTNDIIPVSSLAPESGLLGKDASEAALVDQWVHFGETEIATFSYEIMAFVSGYLGPYNREVRVIVPPRVPKSKLNLDCAQFHDINLERQARALKFLDEHLSASPSGYLISDAMTLADIVVAAVSQQAGKITCGAAERAQYPNVFAHYEKVATHPKVKEAFGEAEFIEEAISYKAKTA